MCTFIFYLFLLMNLEIILHADGFANEKEFLEQEIAKNISQKLDSYILPHLSPENDNVRVEAFFVRARAGFDGKVILSLPGGVMVRTEREDFEKLDDLVRHLFDHIKTQLRNMNDMNDEKKS